MLTAEQIIAQALPADCASCREPLPEPGSQCSSCGHLPPLTRQEAAEQLARPGEVEKVNAEALRASAREMLLTAERTCAEADRLILSAILNARAEESRRALGELTGLRDQASEARDKAVKAADVTAGPLEDARKVSQRCALDEEAARRTRLPAAEVVEAGWKAHRAGQLLTVAEKEHQAALNAAAEAQGLLDRMAGEVRQAEQVLKSAEALAAAEPSYVPLTGETLKVLSQRFISHVTATEQDFRSGGPRRDEYTAWRALVQSLAEATGLRSEWEAASRKEGYQAAKREGNPLLSRGLA